MMLLLSMTLNKNNFIRDKWINIQTQCGISNLMLLLLGMPLLWIKMILFIINGFTIQTQYRIPNLIRNAVLIQRWLAKAGDCTLKSISFLMKLVVYTGRSWSSKHCYVHAIWLLYKYISLYIFSNFYACHLKKWNRYCMLICAKPIHEFYFSTGISKCCNDTLHPTGINQFTQNLLYLTSSHYIPQ